VVDAECIPPAEPFLLVFNHYETRHTAAWWTPILATNVIAARRVQAPREIHFVMAREWWYTDRFGRTLKQPLMQWILARFARVYGFITVPPILDQVNTRGQGALSIRRALALTRGDTPALVGMAPEGRGGPSGALCKPPPGAGIFLLWLSREKIPLLPLGIYETENGLTLHFGEPFLLRASRAPDRTERDSIAATQIMQTIAALVPEAIRGIYSQ
jgi:1-acyl-sn-glycerol-3-phosphate acyltransferase